MSCYSPMLAVPKGINNKTGKVYYSFREKFVDTGQLSEVKLMPDGKYYQVKAVPCGKCIGCRLDYAKQWSTRCTLEMQDYSKDECIFLTLTYDDFHVPTRVVQDEKIIDTLNVDGIEHNTDFVQKDVAFHQTLWPKDLKDFLKRLRSSQMYNYGKKFRFYACGEYGTETFRPHYHLILFGVNVPNKVDDIKDGWKKKTAAGYEEYSSKYFFEVWHKKGNCIVGSCTYESIGYVARYMLKKQKGDDRFIYDALHIVPPFTRMSLKPGIGLKYYDEHSLDIYSEDMIHLTTEKRGIQVRPPKYFDAKFEEEYPDLYQLLKEERSDKAFLSMVAKEEVYGKPISEVLEIERLNKESKTKILKDRSV